MPLDGWLAAREQPPPLPVVAAVWGVVGPPLFPGVAGTGGVVEPVTAPASPDLIAVALPESWVVLPVAE